MAKTRRHTTALTWDVPWRVFHSWFLWEVVALLCVGRHAGRSQRGVSPELPSPAGLKNVQQWEMGESQLEPLNPAGTTLRLIDLKDY